jgi:hypothetical protein
MARTLVTCSCANLAGPLARVRAFLPGEEREEVGRDVRPDWRPQSWMSTRPLSILMGL